MQLSTVLVSALAAVASASPALRARQADCPEVNAVPTCGRPCIYNAAATLGCPDNTDYACMCGQWDALRSAAAGCVITNCGILNALTVLNAVQAVCNACVA
ncbi:hypothetical protein QBC40DRAFT_259921 [Triangularia verruculosa]|uniref:CFEM domain-containing protein n=1 Tax=Triangularia verruculosa TaxID=2587418 RepID=A0AAN6X5P2_9PEZI|nr:hypothetical protein QBC40DRAFT_259921 [Triangularia verruculosa]